MRAGLTPKARRDLELAAAYIAENSRRAARGFLADADKAFVTIAENPEIGPERLELLPPPFRFWRLRRFQYVIVYNASRRPTRVSRIVHEMRDLNAVLEGLTE